MAKANTTTVTHADGSVSKRSSVRATYTHAVVVSRTAASIAAKHRAEAAKCLTAAAEYDVAAQGEILRKQDGKPGSWLGVRTTVTVGGTYADSTFADGEGGRSSERAPLTDEQARAAVQAYGDNARERATQSEERAAKAEAGPAVTYAVLRWSSRADLAQKAAAGEFAGLRTEGVEVYVVPVDAK